jgi:hypothetical protein
MAEEMAGGPKKVRHPFFVFRPASETKDSLEGITMKRFLSVLAVISLLAAAAGCSAPAANVAVPAATAAAVEPAAPAPTQKPTPEPTPEPTIDPAVAAETYKDSCVKLDYNSYARNPDKYGEKNVVFTATAVQVLEDGNYVEMRMAVNDDYDKMLYVIGMTEEDRILEDDTVTVYGVTKGLFTYTSTMGAQITIPKVLALYFEIH